jgi:superfamily I DNA/RNA helicase
MRDITPAEQQRECIEYPGPQLLVTGPPGTGKTLVLLKRAVRLSQAMPTARVVVFTYNKTLAQYANDQLRLNGASANASAVNFHSWAFGQLRRVPVRREVIRDADRMQLIRQLVDQTRAASGVPSSLAARPLDWWRDEIEWIKSSALLDWKAYRDVQRTGRGTGLRTPAREVVWAVFSCYQQHLDDHNLMDFRDFALLLLRAWDTTHRPAPVDHVLIDEAQDLRLTELRVLTQLARQSMTVVADRTQKVYQTTFAWRDLGFDVIGGGRSRVLTKSYRTTRQVALLAASLRRHDPLVRPGDPDYTEGELPDREGPVPVVVATRDADHEAELVLRLVGHLQAARPGQTIGILARTWETLHRLEPALQTRRVPYDVLHDRDGAVTTPRVKLTTFHSAKGLEFGDVILIGLSEGLMPPPLGQFVDAAEGEDPDDVLSIERRLLYVAMTRTRSALYLLHGLTPSRFLAELDPACYTRTAPELVPVAAR